MEFKQAIVIRSDLKMDKGKIAAQASHASLEAVRKMEVKYHDWVENWVEQGQKKIVLKVGSEKDLLDLFDAVKRKFPCALIKDAGHTQVEAGSLTALAIGPLPEKDLDQFTGKLKLL